MCTKKIVGKAIHNTVNLFNKVSNFEDIIDKKMYLPTKKYENVKEILRINNTPHVKCVKYEIKVFVTNPENSCWFKLKEDDKVKETIEYVNNTRIEAELNETNNNTIIKCQTTIE